MKWIRSDQTIKTKITYQRAVRVLTVAIVVLLVVVTVIPGALQLLYRADAQVALGNAKLVRYALQTTGTEMYGMNAAFGDAAQTGGVTEAVYENVLLVSKVPGDFWVLQLGEGGYEVKAFLYWEDEYLVYYDSGSGSYRVCRENTYIGSTSAGED